MTSKTRSSPATKDQPAAAAPYRKVQGLHRGLDILSALNLHRGGAATISQLSEATSLHRTTVRRILETLVQAGYVAPVPSSNQYRLSVRVRSLSSGFRDEVWITDIASEPLSRLTASILWPSDIATLERSEMVIRASTHSLTSLSFHRSMVGRSLPMLSTAVGCAYLAFCPPAECAAILNVIGSRHDKEGEKARNPKAVGKLLDRTRAQGYAFNEGMWIDVGRFNALAVPVMSGERVLACINVIFSIRSISAKEAVARYVEPLGATAREIEERFREESREVEASSA